MTSLDPRIDAYISRSADFAKPILEYVRALVHETCPDVEETIKWGMPTFVHAGGILCAMAAFKQHASFGFWKHALVVGDGTAGEGMGSFGKLTSVADLPTKRQLSAYIKQAARLNEQGIKTPGSRKVTAPKPLPGIPADFAGALRANAAARATFDRFAPSHRREYLEWILDAKREETRARRIEQTVEWLAEGKSRNWKYENC
jgi:hypothetical protein